MAEKINQNEINEKREKIAYYNFTKKVEKKNIDYYHGHSFIY